MLNISTISNEDGGGWVDCGTAGMQTTALQGVDTKAGAQVGLTSTTPNM